MEYEKEESFESMAKISADTVINGMKWRYATKAFDGTRTLAQQDRDALLATLRLAPSSYGLQPWKFVVVDDPGIRRSLGALVPANKPKIEDCALFVVLARRTLTSAEDVSHHVDMLQAERNLPSETIQPLRDMVIQSVKRKEAAALDNWNARQVYVALGCALTAAAMLEIDACPMEGVDPLGFDEMLGLTGTDFTTTVGIAFGYRDENDPFASFPRTRRPIEDVIKAV